MHLVPTDLAAGAVWHIRRGLDAYRALEIERGSTFGNAVRVTALEGEARFELAWASSDLERLVPHVAPRDAYLGDLLRGAVHATREVARQLGQRRYPPGPPYALEQALRSAYSAVDLLSPTS